MTQILPRLNLSHDENIQVINIFQVYLTGNSCIVNAFMMQAFADIAKTKAVKKVIIVIGENAVIQIEDELPHKL